MTFVELQILGFAPRGPIPDYIKEGSLVREIEYEYYVCPRHKQWYVEFDAYFPYHNDNSCCEQCLKLKLKIDKIQQTVNDIHLAARDLARLTRII